MSATPTTSSPVIVTARELHGGTSVCCPNPAMSAWNSHPRVFIDLAKNHGRASCPYCGTVYQIQDGEKLGGGH